MQFWVIMIIDTTQERPYSFFLLFVLEVDDIGSQISKDIGFYLRCVCSASDSVLFFNDSDG